MPASQSAPFPSPWTNRTGLSIASLTSGSVALTVSAGSVGSEFSLSLLLFLASEGPTSTAPPVASWVLVLLPALLSSLDVGGDCSSSSEDDESLFEESCSMSLTMDSLSLETNSHVSSS